MTACAAADLEFHLRHRPGAIHAHKYARRGQSVGYQQECCRVAIPKLTEARTESLMLENAMLQSSEHHVH